MKYQYQDMKAYNLHLFKTDKFKTITIMINFRREIKKDEITIRSFIHLLLLLSSKKYQSGRILSSEAEGLYGPYIGANENRVGNFALTSFYMTMINEKYTEAGMNDKGMDFFKEIIFNPDVDGKGFNKKSFAIAKNEIKAKLKSVKDNPKYYSMVRMLEYMDPESPISYQSGYLEVLNSIDEKKVYDYYKSMLHSDLVDVFILGNIDFLDMKKLVADMVSINVIKKAKKDIYINHKNFVKRLKKAEDEENLSQAKLVVGCKIGNLTSFERKYVLPIYSGILGGPSYSKLFQSVREKNSLAYYIYSNYRRADNLLTISSGINKESYNKVLKLIKEEFNNMSKGNITEDELKRAKEDMISILQNIEDNPLNLINNYMWQFLYSLDDIKMRKDEINKVTINDVKNISKKIYLDTAYLLHGGDENETDKD
ncbi:MAG: pitrilysin family protein [Bacilli bacterium]|nr:pitrilysin family protein [Bacilli bacterium]MDD4053529.1 pitrilysin family protein [Bacilli bacterium]MDD4411504.1 pitrilysin family protein [Bacilli bacterium]